MTKIWKVYDCNEANLFCGITDQHCMLLSIHRLFTDHVYTIPGPTRGQTQGRLSVWEMLAWHNNPQQGSPLCRQIKQSKVLFVHNLFVWSHMSDHFLLKQLPHGLFYLLEEDLRNPTTQGVDGVQELGLDGVEQRLEHVVLKGKLQGQRHFPMSVLTPNLFQFDLFYFPFFFFQKATYPR